MKRFHVAERGYFYQRITLNLRSHLKNSEASLAFCKMALADPLVPDKYRLEIQDRAKILSKEFEEKINLVEWETVSYAFTDLIGS